MNAITVPTPAEIEAAEEVLIQCVARQRKTRGVSISEIEVLLREAREELQVQLPEEEELTVVLRKYRLWEAIHHAVISSHLETKYAEADAGVEGEGEMEAEARVKSEDGEGGLKSATTDEGREKRLKEITIVSEDKNRMEERRRNTRNRRRWGREQPWSLLRGLTLTSLPSLCSPSSLHSALPSEAFTDEVQSLECADKQRRLRKEAEENRRRAATVLSVCLKPAFPLLLRSLYMIGGGGRRERGRGGERGEITSSGAVVSAASSALFKTNQHFSPLSVLVLFFSVGSATVVASAAPAPEEDSGMEARLGKGKEALDVLKGPFWKEKRYQSRDQTLLGDGSVGCDDNCEKREKERMRDREEEKKIQREEPRERKEARERKERNEKRERYDPRITILQAFSGFSAIAALFAAGETVKERREGGEREEEEEEEEEEERAKMNTEETKVEEELSVKAQGEATQREKQDEEEETELDNETGREMEESEMKDENPQDTLTVVKECKQDESIVNEKAVDMVNVEGKKVGEKEQPIKREGLDEESQSMAVILSAAPPVKEKKGTPPFLHATSGDMRDRALSDRMTLLNAPNTQASTNAWKHLPSRLTSDVYGNLSSLTEYGTRASAVLAALLAMSMDSACTAIDTVVAAAAVAAAEDRYVVAAAAASYSSSSASLESSRGGRTRTPHLASHPPSTAPIGGRESRPSPSDPWNLDPGASTKFPPSSSSSYLGPAAATMAPPKPIHNIGAWKRAGALANQLQNQRLRDLHRVRDLGGLEAGGRVGGGGRGGGSGSGSGNENSYNAANANANSNNASHGMSLDHPMALSGDAYATAHAGVGVRNLSSKNLAILCGRNVLTWHVMGLLTAGMTTTSLAADTDLERDNGKQGQSDLMVEEIKPELVDEASCDQSPLLSSLQSEERRKEKRGREGGKVGRIGEEGSMGRSILDSTTSHKEGQSPPPPLPHSPSAASAFRVSSPQHPPLLNPFGHPPPLPPPSSLVSPSPLPLASWSVAKGMSKGGESINRKRSLDPAYGSPSPYLAPHAGPTSSGAGGGGGGGQSNMVPSMVYIPPPLSRVAAADGSYGDVGVSVLGG
eukprot:CAMPEP_0175076922 /NCGR_PEP_ID=MMETSP0052_2-20121109/23049_1 /TAXON_ID=51329 ORGANISM="Polytomella parva, Strain SAG 63-3" /NCGR_SAMPLE_ID=MMETSP0052_2 /ASSEMBLY_ACC=CAM_ASM_000194 /LENGTH=1084 /DNA_ID=CAMNT_0016346221 /DNA_START=1267 /DNA_END=4517 /DNA_ORIENTATION=-